MINKQSYVNRSWQCPYCEHHTVLREDDVFISEHKIELPGENKQFTFLAIKCFNSECKELFSKLEISSLHYPAHSSCQKILFKEFQLTPDSGAKSFPKYIPQQLRNDYEEACSIKLKSPKASATLSRRCIQGIIRDFWGIKNKKNLYDEIEALQNSDQIDPALLQSLHDIREIGNIGAHMKKDVNIIIDVKSEEAQALIDIIEVLFVETYITREKRKERIEKLNKIAKLKK
ncbi:TPA: DUF4145 domain-containing protein [Legionella pneumophila]|uniref:DUF4145 domain-containing protein n=1 Tax=Legionella pneumophila TaxID=446 RepID=UPI000489EF7A|nr:DUF4145 domain-containing protein [Legionella pneumophila]RYW86821.1 DUF4145 domain-containing protein [Legionella pneumophila]STX99764.1 Uncharacterised protein [Legionella pneumophila]HAT1776579.1 DUF4145 domain-containing protein [Legionella pneumophila]HAT1779581.1 DUF4145 domain-containing protein [Legionella pneumophila]HAT2019894.1 DUF4145 domain-containing protein [Legionella pneumophila]